MQYRKDYKDAVRGCIFGGAAGDALGYAVEFLDLENILADYGPRGITGYDYDSRTGLALISDDTQMTLFTATGYLAGEAGRRLRGTAAAPSCSIARAYGDWYMTQIYDYGERDYPKRVSWLMDVPALYSQRAPGITCLSALEQTGRVWEETFVERPINNSKGCGGVMRVAPLALVPWENICQLDCEAAQVAAVTHSHPLGYLPAAVLCHILQSLLYPADADMDLEGIIRQAQETVCTLFRETEHVQTLARIIDLAIELAGNKDGDVHNIQKLGGGWVGEEALAISLYCALRYSNDFSAGIIAAVNHDGDSDSTGAITGNILGAMVGYSGIEQKWKENLELADVILEVADDLCLSGDGSSNPEWTEKYVYAKRKR